MPASVLRRLIGFIAMGVGALGLFFGLMAFSLVGFPFGGGQDEIAEGRMRALAILVVSGLILLGGLFLAPWRWRR
jgi:hypothetical protein